MTHSKSSRRASSIVSLGIGVALLGIGIATQGCGEGTCIEGPDCTSGRTSVEKPVAPEPAPPAPLCTDIGKEYVGLGGASLVAARDDGAINADRGRMKPYSVLTTEYARVLGDDSDPVLVAETASTFGSVPERWYAEPHPNAVSLYTAFRIGFEGCLRKTGAIATRQAMVDPRYSAEPTDETLRPQCAQWARTFWSREPLPDEVQACVEAGLEAKSETVPDKGQLIWRETTPERRWAYACASLLTATGFLSY